MAQPPVILTLGHWHWPRGPWPSSWNRPRQWTASESAPIDLELQCYFQLLNLLLRHNCPCHSRCYRHCPGLGLKGHNHRSRHGHWHCIRHRRHCHHLLDLCCYCWLCSCRQRSLNQFIVNKVFHFTFVCQALNISATQWSFRPDFFKASVVRRALTHKIITIIRIIWIIVNNLKNLHSFPILGPSLLSGSQHSSSCTIKWGKQLCILSK